VAGVTEEKDIFSEWQPRKGLGCWGPLAPLQAVLHCSAAWGAELGKANSQPTSTQVDASTS
jgi:hypothetical protein